MNHKLILSSIITLAAWATAQNLTSLGNDPAYPPQLYVVGVGSSPVSQADADNLAVMQIQKQITVTVKVNQESGMASKRKGNQEEVQRWLDSRTTMNSRGDLQGADIVKRFQKDKNFIAVAALSKSKFAAQKRLNMSEAAKAITTLASQAKTDAEANKLADALSVRSRIEERVRDFESERLLLSAVETLLPGDTVPVNLDQLNKIFNTALKKLAITPTAGADQTLTDPAQSLQPWVVQVTAADVPIAEMPLKLVSPDRKVVRTAITDVQGQATFFPDSYVPRGAGEQFWKVMADLQVTRAQMDIVERKRAEFHVTITPQECRVNIQTTGVKSAAARTEIGNTLANYGFKNDPSAKKTLVASVTTQQKGFSQGLSDQSSFAMLEVSLALDVQNAAGRSLQSALAKAVGTGNVDAATVSAIKKMQIGPDASLLSKAACGDGSPAKPLPTLAVLPFKTPRFWYSDQAKAEMLADMVAGAIHRTESYQIVERTRLNEIVKEQSTGQQGLIADPVEVGQLLGAQFVLMGTLVGNNWGNVKVEGRIVDTKTGTMAKAFSASGSLESIADQIAKQAL
ncbi:MAG TPA: CsgG/HfaB family protein [Fibrobacteraceae bacterium]|nr:CsgG/HfaB family protein [Fibrobacteraceae bacterium]